MVSSWALGNFPSGDFTDYTSSPYGFDIGVMCGASVAATVTRLRWYRRNTSTGHKPDHLRLWDVLTGGLLYETADVPDDGSIGWQVHTIVDPIAVDARQALIVSADHETYHDEALYEIALLPPPDPPALLWFPSRWSVDVAFDTIPNTPTVQYLTGVDAEFTTTGGGSDYEVVAEIDYNNAIKWGQAADRYLLDVTTIAGWETAKIVDGVDVRRIVGGWQPLSGSYQGKRFPIDSPHFLIELPNQARIQGVLVDTSPGSTGHLTALVKTV